MKKWYPMNNKLWSSKIRCSMQLHFLFAVSWLIACIICLIVWVSVGSLPSNSFLHCVHQRHTSLWRLEWVKFQHHMTLCWVSLKATWYQQRRRTGCCILPSKLSRQSVHFLKFEAVWLQMFWLQFLAVCRYKITSTKDSLSILGVKFATMWRRRGTFWNEQGRNRKIYSRLK